MTTDQDIALVELVGTEVTAITLDSSIEITFGAERRSILRIERPFVVVDSTGSTAISFSPPNGELPGGLDRLAATVGSVVVKAVARATGALDIELADGATLHVDPLARHEAWTLTGPEGVLASLPGGGLG